MRTNTYNTVLRDFATMANAMNRAFERNQPAYDYARNGGSSSEANGEKSAPKLRLPLDVASHEDAFVITAYIPGINPETVEITWEGEELTIRGEFPQTEEKNWAKRELFRGAFERRLTFNVPVNADAIEATSEYGVLTLRLPKAEAVRPKQIKVVTK
ncbi:MAG: Hsp20/alpha crystallin family protein [Caldilineaceae bacterium]|nr:Hsp20/alpha crystallin family protein [Caldilineaceae bacterium]